MEYPVLLSDSKSDIIRILCSFSGGNTSSVMTQKLLHYYECSYDFSKGFHIGKCPQSGKEVNITVIFANTGREHLKTLEFVNNCDLVLGFHSIWIQSLQFKGKRKGARPEVIEYISADRDGVVFERVIEKHGIPNQKVPHCTRELKERPIHWYVKNVLKWPEGSYYTAIGYRIDEPKRYASPEKRASAEKRKFIFPIADWFPMTKAAVNEFCSQRSFILGLEEWEGNCMFCWKKSEAKLMIQAYFSSQKEIDWVLSMEEKYENYTPEGRNEESIDTPWRFFRGKKSIKEIVKLAKQYFDEAGDDEVTIEVYKNALLGFSNEDDNSGCTESCEAFSL